jgi:hypothetical protein
MTAEYAHTYVQPSLALPNGEEVTLLRAMLAEAAQVILRCIGEGVDFDGDVECYASRLLAAADQGLI